MKFQSSLSCRPDQSVTQVLPVNEGVLSAVGNTPLVKLDRLFPDSKVNLFAKLEMLNPGGSIKDRPALNMLQTAWQEGKINGNSTIIESSSGNLGIGMSQVCAILGLRFICVVDPKTTTQNLKLMKLYGAEISMVTEPDPATNDFLPARIARVNALLEELPGAYWCNQYANLANAGAHHQTISEIMQVFDNNVDYLFCAASSCGTLRGCSDYIYTQNLPTKIIAVDAVGSVIFGGPRKKRLVPGHGAARVPELYNTGLEDTHIYTTDEECVLGCRRLLISEGLLAGGSSGAVVMAISKVIDKLPADSTCVAIFCDRGERYLDTVYSDTWVEENLNMQAAEHESVSNDMFVNLQDNLTLSVN
ncbi:2,3-diaminopropionate biosynthesis protein SbnA [Chloroflexi bacterium TSY]|nr:2,3-diaminopropionate biosynthesis protein SbnA [Chloroflexi bacterium TSY]